MKLIKYAESVEVPTNSTTKTKFYFQEQPTLRNKRILYISSYTNNQITKSPSNLNIITPEVFYRSFLVLASKNKEIINRIPMIQFWLFYAGINSLLFDLIIDFPKSYIEISSTEGLNTNETFLFTFYYNDQIKEAPEYRGINIENIEVETTPATIQKFYFPDHENLRGKNIQYMEYVHSYVGKSSSGDNLVNTNMREKSYLTVASKRNEIIRKMPIYALRSEVVEGFRIPFDNIEIDLPNTYFEVPNTDDIIAGQKYLMNFYFYDRILGKT